MKYTALTLTFVLCLVSLTTAHPRRTQSAVAGKGSAKTPTMATGAKAAAATTPKTGATAQAKASTAAPKAAVKATAKIPGATLPKATGAVKVAVAPKAKATLGASADISGSTKASTPAKAKADSPAKTKAKVVVDPLAGTCPQATYLQMKPFITMFAKNLPFCPDLKTYCCHYDTMKTWYSEYLYWTKEISATFWSITKFPAVNGLFLSHLNSDMIVGGPHRRRLQTITGNTSGSVKVNTGAKVGVKAQVNAGAKVDATVPVVAQGTADAGKLDNSIHDAQSLERHRYTLGKPSTWNLGKTGRPLFVKAWNYHNEVASKRQLFTKQALICLKEFVKFKGAVVCSACDPKNEEIYAESVHVNTESAKPMLEACVPWI